MIPCGKTVKTQCAGRQFTEWAWLFCGKYFVFVKPVVVYGDESGTHDRLGYEKGSDRPIIAGFAAPISEWTSFCIEWQAVLNSYRAPYFHFREWAAASAAIRFKKTETAELRKNPFFKWDLTRLDDFLLALAKVAGKGNKIIIAGGIKLPAINKIMERLKVESPNDIGMDQDPFKFCMSEFFRVYHKETWCRWGDFKAPVTFIFDQSDDPQWTSAIYEVFRAYQSKDDRLKDIVFADKKTRLPLQAADLVAYRLRQMTKGLEDNTLVFKTIDTYLFKHLWKSAGVANPNLIPILQKLKKYAK
jgi:hypothetical protein